MADVLHMLTVHAAFFMAVGVPAIVIALIAICAAVVSAGPDWAERSG